jgi:hypothetical protein
MPNHILAAVASNPASNWVNQWKAGWDSTPSAHAASAPNTGLVMLALVAAIVLVIYALLRRSAA